MVTMNVSLPETMKTWVENQAGNGGYSNTSDYVRDLIRRDQKRQTAITTLQAAISAGIDSGAGENLDAATFKQRMRERHGDR